MAHQLSHANLSLIRLQAPEEEGEREEGVSSFSQLTGEGGGVWLGSLVGRLR